MLLLSLLVAFGLWLYVVTDVSPGYEQTFKNLPVTLENENSLMDRNLMLLSGQDSKVSVRLYGNRSDLNELNSSNIAVSVDLSGITEPGEYEREYKVSFPSGISSISISQRITPSVKLEVVEYAEKEIPVKLIFRGQLQEGLLVGQERATMSATSVSVAGPKSQVDQIDFAGLEIDCTGLTSTLTGEFRYTLMDRNGKPVDAANVKTNTGSIQLTLPVEHIKEIPLVVKLVAGGGADLEANADVAVEPKTITISGSEEALSKYNEWVLTTVNLGDVDIKTPYSEEVEIKLPENLTNQSNIPTAKVQVSLKGLSTKTVTLTKDNIHVRNVPEGMNSTVFTQQLDVVLRGGAAELQKMTPDNIVAWVDMAGYEAGTQTLPLSFEIKGVEKVGVYGKYSVTVGLAAASADPTPEP